jgi:hypothetical protein
VGEKVSLYVIMLVGGSLVSAFLVLHHLAAIKQNGDELLAAYRRLLTAARTRVATPMRRATNADFDPLCLA